jgi:hypothetical protein
MHAMTESTLYVLPATQALVAAVFLRLPAKTWMVGRWDLQTGDVEQGAWLRGQLYPRRCDLSPDGELLYYFFAKTSRRPFMGMVGRQTFSAVSKLPWAFALAAWPEADTWTRGYHFTSTDRWDIGEPQHGDAKPLRARFGLSLTEPEQYAVERRRGWIEHPSCPVRDPADRWDEKRSVVLMKPHPTRDMNLVLEDCGWTPGAIGDRAPEYHLESGGRSLTLDDAVWADWHPAGFLLVATEDSRLQIRAPQMGGMAVLHDRDLSSIRPNPGPAPAWAQRW